MSDLPKSPAELRERAKTMSHARSLGVYFEAVADVWQSVDDACALHCSERNPSRCAATKCDLRHVRAAIDRLEQL
jgi:hypothetical protein